jgi:antitoxin HigA-1
MTADMALRMSLLTGTSVESWLVNQVQWDLWRISQQRWPKMAPIAAHWLGFLCGLERR